MADPVFTLMIDPVSHCNLRCRYCYAPNRTKERIPVDVVVETLEKTARYMETITATHLHIIWHGGEPLLGGIDFFLQSLSHISRIFSGACTQFIQTNGLLMDRDWCLLFKAEGVNVGISLDGPKQIHDALRCREGGKGTWDLVMEKIGLMESLGLPFGICKTLTSLSLGKEKSIYDFFYSLGHPVKINPLIPPGEVGRVRGLLLNPGEYGRFMNHMMDEWLERGEARIRISPLDTYLAAVLGKGDPECRGQVSCSGRSLGIKPDGRAVLCSPFDSLTLGNIRDNSIESLFSHPACRLIEKRLGRLDDCLTCINRSLCNGGCPHLASAFTGSIGDKDPFCRDYKLIFSHLRRMLERAGALC